MTQPTIDTLQKRVIRAEIKSLKSAKRKIATDANREFRRIVSDVKKLMREHASIGSAVKRESTLIDRRLSILQGRL